LETAFVDLIDALRRLQDLTAGARPTVDLAAEATREISMAADLLAGCQVAERDQIAGKQSHIPGRAQSLIPPVYYDRADGLKVEARLTFTRFYLGGGGAVHGGVLPLVFDELFGRLAGSGGRPRSRTAYLHVNYRNVTPLGKELRIEGSVDRTEGRKVVITGSLSDGETLLCDAEGLFVTLKSGQP
jgi:acyl-coenzyme A thioesterase PaaI-like protein